MISAFSTYLNRGRGQMYKKTGAPPPPVVLPSIYAVVNGSIYMIDVLALIT